MCSLRYFLLFIYMAKLFQPLITYYDDKLWCRIWNNHMDVGVTDLLHRDEDITSLK